MRILEASKPDAGREITNCVSLSNDELRLRCAELESVLRDYVIEAHVHSIDGLDECDHEAGVCFCAYHVALGRAVDVLDDPTLTRLVRVPRYDGSCGCAPHQA